MINSKYLNTLIKNAYSEDVGDGDHTSLACVPNNVRGNVYLLVKQDGVIAGVEVAQKVFEFYDSTSEIDVRIEDGAKVKSGDIVFYLNGNQQKLLQAERTALNFMQRMSGIATITRNYADTLNGYKAKVLDTRKTTPGLRLIEKEAVRIGGGVNHRFGLYDMIMIKDNHVDFAGGIKQAIKNVQSYLIEKKLQLKVEIEVRNLDELNQVLSFGGVQRIMLDNFTIDDTLRAVEKINGCYEVESSGGITLENIRDYAACNVDFISVGALTHHIRSLDLSLKASK
jgi:nicotinate-nucleotide pyrophosphorylase (carboxylating)